MGLEGSPTYDLGELRALVRAGKFRVTGTAMDAASSLSFDEEDVRDCVLQLAASDFFKTMPSHHKAGLHQDVYRPMYAGVRLYVKVQIIHLHPTRNEMAVVISFKRK